MSPMTSESSFLSPELEGDVASNRQPFRVLIVEDDPQQSMDVVNILIQDAPRQRALECVTANSEYAALQELALAKAEGTWFDAYVVDLHLPWVQADTVPEIPPEVREKGPLVAGFRVARQISQDRATLTRPGVRQPPIILFTIDDGPETYEFNRPEIGQYAIVKGDTDLELVTRVFLNT